MSFVKCVRIGSTALWVGLGEVQHGAGCRIVSQTSNSVSCQALSWQPGLGFFLILQHCGWNQASHIVGEHPSTEPNPSCSFSLESGSQKAQAGLEQKVLWPQLSSLWTCAVGSLFKQVCVHMCMWVHAPLYVSVEARGEHWVSLLSSSSSSFILLIPSGFKLNSPLLLPTAPSLGWCFFT